MTALARAARKGARALPFACLVLACGTAGPTEAPGGAGAASPPESLPGAAPPPAAPAPAYEIHEWGLVDVPLGGVPAELAAGPGRAETLADSTMPPPTAPIEAEPVRPPRPPRPPPPVIHPSPPTVRKPVVYVHLTDGTRELRFDADVRLGGGGRVIEHWPDGTREGERLRWVGVVARACTALPLVPDFGRACDTTDGYCERHDLATYVAPGVACLEVGGVRAPFLFYRGTSPLDALPLRHTPASAGAIEVVYAGAAPASRRVLRFLRTPAGLRVHAGEIPDGGGAFTLDEPTALADRPALEAALRADLAAHGLDAPEADAFLRAWADELFDTPAPRSAPAVLDAYLLYWAPRDAVERIAELSLRPPPSAVHRALLARVELRP